MASGTEIAHCPLFVPAELIRRFRELEREVKELRARANIEFLPPFHVDSIPSHSTAVSIQCVQELSSDLQTIDIDDTGGSITNIDAVDPLIITNTRGSAIAQFGIVGLGEGTESPQDDYATFAEAVYVDSASPGNDTRFAIVLKAVANGSTTPAVAAGGPVQVKVNRTSTAHNYAGSTSGNYDYLTSGTSGIAEITAVDNLPALAIGETVLTGSGAPGGGTGSDGDYYSDTVGEQWYGPKTAGAWGSANDYKTGICWAHVVLDQSGSGGSTDSFKTIAVDGQSNVVADSSTDTLTIVAGSNVTITTDASTDTITIAGDCCAPEEIGGQAVVYQILESGIPGDQIGEGPGIGGSTDEWTWTVPECVTEILVECFGKGGTSAVFLGDDVGGAGGGGGYSAATLTVAPGEVYFPVFDHGILADPQLYVAFLDTDETTPLVAAQDGESVSTGFAGGVGGQTTNAVGDVKYAGGDGGDSYEDAVNPLYYHAGGGGGGGAGSAGPGSDGEDATIANLYGIIASGGAGHASGGSGTLSTLVPIFTTASREGNFPNGGGGGFGTNLSEELFGRYGGQGMIRITWGVATPRPVGDVVPSGDDSIIVTTTDGEIDEVKLIKVDGGTF